ncbi:MAG: ribonuclease P protein component [Planctomycetes bacterium]|nr:ribonuclease P protein component [Planctomycetota bacterium]
MHPYLTDQRLRKEERLLVAAQFEAVFDTRLSAGNKFLVLHWRENGLGHPRLGLVVSRKFGNAVARNRFKRRLRELFRHNKALCGSLDVVVLPGKRPEARAATLEDTRDSLFKLLRKAAGQESGGARTS